MNIKTISGFLSLLVLSFVLYATKPSNNYIYISLPVIMLLFPILVGHRVKIRFSLRDITIGLIVSAVILVPYYLIFGGNLSKISGFYMLFLLLNISLPEEFFFRGFIQDSMGRNLRAVFIVSVLFSLAHLPKALFLEDWISLLSFFPSLIMGWLYMKTNNILPGTMFHLFANLVYNLK